MDKAIKFEPVELDVVTIAGEVSIEDVDEALLQKFSCDPPCQ